MQFDLTSAGEIAAAVVAIGGLAGLVSRQMTAKVQRDVVEVEKDVGDLGHRIKNQTTRIDAIEHLRLNDIERIVKLESAQQSFDKAVERVERGQDRLAEMINDRFDTLAASIREIRTVGPK